VTRRTPERTVNGHTVSDESLDQIYRKARTHNVWLDKPVDDALLRQVYDLAKMGPTRRTVAPCASSREVQGGQERLKPALDARERATRR